MQEHSDLVHSSFPKPGMQMTDVSQIRRPANDNKNLDLGLGGMSESDLDKSWSNLGKQLSKPDLKLVPKE